MCSGSIPTWNPLCLKLWDPTGPRRSGMQSGAEDDHSGPWSLRPKRSILLPNPAAVTSCTSFKTAHGRLREQCGRAPPEAALRTSSLPEPLPQLAHPLRDWPNTPLNRSHEIPPAHHRLRRQTNHRVPHQEGHHPLPQALHRMRGLPARHDRLPSPTSPTERAPIGGPGSMRVGVGGWWSSGGRIRWG